MTTVETYTKSAIMPALRYQDAPAAIEWLCHVLGFERHAVYPGPDGTIGHAELILNGGMVMLGSKKDDEYGRNFKAPQELSGFETCGMYVIVTDADAAYERAQAAGAWIARPIESTHYGSREFSVKDPEGHTWTVGTYDPWTKQDDAAAGIAKEKHTG
jgi:uncharacterized glyoxalase superfamily protein PhnB